MFLYMGLFSVKRDKRGAVAAEYAFLIAFIGIVAAIGMVSLGTGLLNYFDAFGNAIGNAASQS
jgi:Flp pilus assembly pilin Flp